jgi:signal transduction histidine kinase
VALANHRTDWPATASSVVDELRNVETLVADLVFLARADEAHVQHRFDDVDIDDIVLEEAARVRGRGRVAVDTSGVTPVRARGDAGQLHRAIRNLVENAERHAVATVTLTVQPVAGGAHVMVADDGPGIPPADRDRIFGRFVRLDQARNQAHGGSGLGLAIARQVVTAHGGTVEVADSDGGARFAVFLPLALQAAPVRMGA